MIVGNLPGDLGELRGQSKFMREKIMEDILNELLTSVVDHVSITESSGTILKILVNISGVIKWWVW